MNATTKLGLAVVLAIIGILSGGKLLNNSGQYQTALDSTWRKTIHVYGSNPGTSMVCEPDPYLCAIRQQGEVLAGLTVGSFVFSGVLVLWTIRSR